MTSFSIGNISVQPGAVAKGKLGSLYLSDGTQVDIPLLVVHGASEGPVLWVSAAMHGQEMSGIAAIWELVQKWVDPASLRGTLVAAPLLNPLSFNGGTYYTPQDGYNVNRVFPGSPTGLTTQRLANMIVEEGLNKVDYLIDFHANPEPAMCFTIVKEAENAAVFARSKEMAEAFGITTIEMVLKYEAHRTGTMIDTASSLGKPAIVIELVPWRSISPLAVKVGVRGALNVMKKLGMIDGALEEQSDILVFQGQFSRTEVTATRGGLARELKAPGDAVKKGEVIGQIVDAYGDPLEDIISPVDGWLLAWSFMGNQAANTGDILAFFVFQQGGGRE
jgi:uncharacterized protein